MTTLIGRPPELDDAAAEALAAITLLTTGDARDAATAGDLLAELLAAPDGVDRVVHGLSSICAALLALLEFHDGAAPGDALKELGRIISEAVTLP